MRLATFLHVAGADALEKYNGFLFHANEDRNDLQTVLQKFDSDCKSTINILVERHKFYSRKQRINETCEQFVTDLRNLNKSCEFLNPDEVLRDQFTLNVKNVKVKERLIAEATINYKELSFDKAIAIVKAYEAINIQPLPDERMDEKMEINRVENKTLDRDMIKSCKFCGRSHKYGKCPAYGKECHKCNGKKHFAVK